MCGIVGVVLGVFPFFVGWVLGIIAIVFGVLARKRADADPAVGRRGMATAGIVLGIIAIVATIVWIILFAAVIDSTNSVFDDIQYCIAPRGRRGMAGGRVLPGDGFLTRTSRR